jgi:hypothetical protein
VTASLVAEIRNDDWPRSRVAVIDDEITDAAPGTSYAVT